MTSPIYEANVSILIQFDQTDVIIIISSVMIDMLLTRPNVLTVLLELFTLEW